MPDASARSAAAQVCATCGAVIPQRAPGGQCPRCLLRLASSPDLSEPPPDDDFLDDTQVREFGDYELLEEIARGGMGVVYRAWQISAAREVAVKMILAGQLATPAAVARFRNEAAAAAKLDHPHIVPVYEIGEFETQHFFSMRYVPGGRNIAQWARALPGERRFQAIALAMAEVARALAFAHERGVLHRDLKPPNILIDENDEPQVTDFGLAKLLDDDGPALTVTSAILGSPSYMAPEQAAGHGREVTAATDVYGLGAILYELLAGRPPFEGPSPLIVARRVVEETAPALTGVPADLDTLCRKCLAKEPARRYASALALAEDLERYARGTPIEARPESSLQLLGAWARRRPVVAGLLAALAVVFLAGFAGVAWQWREAVAARASTQSANTELRSTIRRLDSTIDHLEWRSLDVLLERDYASRALAELSYRLRADPQNWQAASYAISILEQRPFVFPAGPAVVVEEEWLAVPPAFNVETGRAAFAGKDGRVRILDTARGGDACPPLELKEVAALAFSPDGSRLAVGEKSGAVVLCELPSGRRLGRTETLASPLRALTFSADGRTLALAGGTYVIGGPLEDFAAGLTPLRLIAAGFEPTQLRCSADGRTLLAWGKGRTLAVWGPPGSGQPFAPPIAQAVRDASIDAAGARIAVGVGPYEVHVWDVTRRANLSSLEGIGAQVRHLAITPDGRRVVTGDHIGVSRAYSADTGLASSAPMVQRYMATGQVLDRTGARVLTLNQDFTARLWDVRTGAPLCEAIPHEGPVESAALSADGTRAFTLARVAGRQTRVLRSWRIRAAAGPRTFCPEGGRDLDGSQLSPDERLLAVGAFTPRTSISVFDVASGRPLLDRAPTEGSVYSCEFTPDGRRLIVATNAGWLYGWAVPTADDSAAWQPLWPPIQTPSRLQPAGLSPDGTLIALGGTDGTLRLHDTGTGRVLREMKHGALIKGVRFSPDGTRLATAGTDAFAHVWRVGTGEKLATLRGHTAEIVSARFSPDGTRLVTASYDSTARVWNAATGQPLTPALQHHGELSGASFNAAGRLIGTASRDGTARLWDAGTGEPVFEPIAHPTTVQYLAFHPDGRRFLTVDLAGFRLWDVATGEPVTLPYPLDMHGGLGVDAPSFQDILSPRADHLCLANALDAAIYWPLPDPPAPVPAWFPDFLDDVATGGLGPAGGGVMPPANRLLPWLARARAFGDTGYYEKWLRKYCGEVAP